MNYGGFWQRLAALLIDGVLIGVVTSIIMAIVQRLLWTAALSEDAKLAWVLLAIAVTTLLLPLAYFAALEAGPWQATLGKRAMGLAVSDETGGRIGWGKSIGRNISKLFISNFVTLGIGSLIAAFTDRKQALHDMIAGTVVVLPVPRLLEIPTPQPSPPPPPPPSGDGWVLGGYSSDGHPMHLTVYPSEFAKYGGFLVIGRDPSICHIIINDDSVSRRHAQLTSDGGAIFIEDLHSVNGTFIDGQPVRQRVRLQPHSKLAIGGVELTFC